MRNYCFFPNQNFIPVMTQLNIEIFIFKFNHIRSEKSFNINGGMENEKFFKKHDQIVDGNFV